MAKRLTTTIRREQIAEAALALVAEQGVGALTARNVALAVGVTASFGITQLRQGDTLHDWLRRADQAMYKSKRMGRNQCTAQQ